MHRLGFEKEDLSEVIQLLSQNPNIQWLHLFLAHLAAADESDQDEFSNHQAGDV